MRARAGRADACDAGSDAHLHASEHWSLEAYDSLGWMGLRGRLHHPLQRDQRTYILDHEHEPRSGTRRPDLSDAALGGNTMSIRRVIFSAAMLTLLLSQTVLADDPTCEIQGTIGLDPVTEDSYAAIWVPLEEGQAIAGLRWLNNDGQLVYPAVLVASGVADEPVDASEAEIAATDVQGPSLDWMAVDFAQQYVCTSDGVYCLVELPLGSEYSGPGSGGGAAFGYYDGEC